MTTVTITSQKLDRTTRRYQTHYARFWEECLWTVGDVLTKRWWVTHQVEWVHHLSGRTSMCGASGTSAEAIRVMCDLHPPENHIYCTQPAAFPVQHPLTDGFREITSQTQFPGLTLDWNVNYFCPFALRVDRGTRVHQLRKCYESNHGNFHQRRMFSTTFSRYIVQTVLDRSKAFAFPKNPKLAGVSPGILPKPIESIVRRYLTENEMTIAEFRHACSSALRGMSVGIEGYATLSIEARGSELVFCFSPA